MGIDTGFYTGGFVDDRREENRWKQFEERINGSNSNASGDVEEEERIEREAAIALAEEEAAAEEAEQRVLALESRGLNVEVVDDDDSIISMVTTKGVFLPTGWFSTYVQEKNRKNSYPF